MSKVNEYLITIFDRATGDIVKDLVFDNAPDRNSALKSYDYVGSVIDTVYREDGAGGYMPVVLDTAYVAVER